MPAVDRMGLDEYLSQNSDFKRAAITVDKMYDGLLSGTYKVVLGDCTTETRLRQLHQRVTELNNMIRLSKGNQKELIKQIDRLRIDLSELRNSLIEFLLTIERRVNRFIGLFEQSCAEYGLDIKANTSNKSALRWDHLRPDPPLVVSSLAYVELFSKELEDCRRDYQENLSEILNECRSLGMKNLPASEAGRLDFQELRYNVNLILGAVDISGLCEMSRAVSKFFMLALKLKGIFSDPNVKLKLEAKYAEPELHEFELKFEKSGKWACPLLQDIAKLAAAAAEDTSSLVTNISEISLGFEALEGLVCTLKRMKLCLLSAPAFLIDLSRQPHVKDTDFSEEYNKLATRVPPNLESIPSYTMAATTFRNLTRELERVLK